MSAEGSTRYADGHQDPYLAELIEYVRTHPHGGGIQRTKRSLAHALGITDETYRQLELGIIRNRHDPLLLGRLADALGMDAGERRSLFVLSGLPIPQRGETAPDSHEIDAHRRIITALAMPAMVHDRWGTVLAANPGFIELFPALPEGSNLTRWIVAAPEARTELIDWWPSWARPALRIIKTLAAEMHDEPLWDFYHDLLRTLPLEDRQIPVGRHAASGEYRRKYVNGEAKTLRWQGYRPTTEVPCRNWITVFEVRDEEAHELVRQARRTVQTSRYLRQRIEHNRR